MGEPFVSEATTRPAGVGIVGLGSISGAYLSTFPRLAALKLVAVADIDRQRAQDVATEHGVRALTVDELVADPDVDVVLNLTIPAAHAEVAHKAIAAGKQVYGEKPLTATLAEAHALMDAAAQAGVRVGCAPDTVLGTGIQTARKAIDDGLIGRPIAATATMVTPGHERWHPNPDFYYQPGGGPLLDMGPYYVSALVTLLGPVVSVVASANRTRQTRTIGSGPRAGEQVPVDVDTHITGVLRHASGALSTLVMSFDAIATHAANIEIHGDAASLRVPDPNGFDGEVRIHPLGGEWQTLTPDAGYRDAARGYGLADFVTTDPSSTPRASGELAFHVLEVMTAVHAAADSGTTVEIVSAPERPAAVPFGDAPGGIRS